MRFQLTEASAGTQAATELQRRRCWLSALETRDMHRCLPPAQAGKLAKEWRGCTTVLYGFRISMGVCVRARACVCVSVSVCVCLRESRCTSRTAFDTNMDNNSTGLSPCLSTYLTIYLPNLPAQLPAHLPIYLSPFLPTDVGFYVCAYVCSCATRASG